MKKLFLFGYCIELFMFLKFLGYIHASWWWLVWMVIADTGTYQYHKKYILGAK